MQPFPRWVSWIFVGLLAYILYMGNQAQKPPESTPDASATPLAVAATEEESARDYDALGRLVDRDRWLRAINPAHVGDASIREITVGHGAAASCGDEVEVRLRGTDSNGANFDPSHDESTPLRFQLGASPIPALNEGLIGLRLGGVRQLVAPAKFVYHDTAKRTLNDITFHLTLTGHETGDSTKLSAIAVTLVEGTRTKEPARCGFPLTVKLAVFDTKGERLYQTEDTVRITLGKRELAWGVDMLARGMRVGEERVLTLPPNYLLQSKDAAKELVPIRRALQAREVRFLQLRRVE